MKDIERKLYEANSVLDDMYAQRVVELVRVRYDINSELAILRQRTSKKAEFNAYNEYVEQCKAQARAEIYGEENAETE